MPETAEAIVPEFYLYRRDVTGDYLFSDEGKDLVKRCGGRIIEIYVFDANRHVHCCELRASYEMHYVETIPGGECEHPDANYSPYDNDVDEALRDANRETDQVIYIHAFDVSKRPEDNVKSLDYGVDEWEELLDDHDNDREKAHAEAVEQMLEGLSCNPPY